MSSHDLPAALRYPLFVPRIIGLCIRYHALPSIITHANPGLPFGGLPFGPKHEIFSLFGTILPFDYLPIVDSSTRRFSIASDFAAIHGFPIIVKPDIGHRGVDVQRADDIEELEAIIFGQTWDYIVQRYSPLPEEYGIFYCKMPDSKRGEIISLTHKKIPVLKGDGESTIQTLIDASDIHNKTAVAGTLVNRLDEIPAEGVTIQTLVGASHAAGSMYYNAAHLETEELRKKVFDICSVKGFYFGRLDVKCEGAEHLRRGEFEIVEINGSTSECIHVYDARIPFIEGLGVLNDQWDRLFRISAAHRNEGEGIGLIEMIKLYKRFYSATKRAVGRLW